MTSSPEAQLTYKGKIVPRQSDVGQIIQYYVRHSKGDGIRKLEHTIRQYYSGKHYLLKKNGMGLFILHL